MSCLGVCSFCRVVEYPLARSLLELRGRRDWSAQTSCGDSVNDEAERTVEDWSSLTGNDGKDAKEGSWM